MNRTEFLQKVYSNKVQKKSLSNEENYEMYYESDLNRLGADDVHQSWLHVATINAKPQLITELLLEGADPNLIIEEDSVLGSILLPMGEFDNYKEIIKKKEEPHFCIESNNNDEIVKTVEVLLKAGAKAINYGEEYSNANVVDFLNYYKKFHLSN